MFGGRVDQQQLLEKKRIGFLSRGLPLLPGRGRERLRGPSLVFLKTLYPAGGNVLERTKGPFLPRGGKTFDIN